MPWEPDLLNTPAAAPEEEGSFLGTVAKQVGAGATDLAAGGVGLLADAAETPRTGMARQLQDQLNEVTRTIQESRAPAQARIADADLTSSEFWKNPGRGALYKAASLVAPLLGFAAVPEGIPGVIMGSAMGALQAGGAQKNDTRKEFNAIPDDELQQQSSVYAKYRADGMSEDDAKEKLIGDASQYLALTMAGGALGGGALGHALKGAASKGFLASLGIGAGENAVAMGAQSGAADIAQQKGQIDVGMRTGYDPSKTALAVADGSIGGALLGGVVGAVRGVRGRPRPETTGKGKASPDAGEPDLAQGAALAPDATGGAGQSIDKMVDDIVAGTKAPPAAEPPAGGDLQSRLQDLEANKGPDTAAPAPPVVATEAPKPPTIQPPEPLVRSEPPPLAEAPKPPPQAPALPERAKVFEAAVQDAMAPGPNKLSAGVREWNKAQEPADRITINDIRKEAAVRRQADREAAKAAAGEAAPLTVAEVAPAIAEMPKKAPPAPRPSVPSKVMTDLAALEAKPEPLVRTAPKEAPKTIITPEGKTARVLTAKLTPEREAEIAAAKARMMGNAKKEVAAPVVEAGKSKDAERQLVKRHTETENKEAAAKALFDEQNKNAVDKAERAQAEDAVLKKNEGVRELAYDRMAKHANEILDRMTLARVKTQRAPSSKLAPGEKNLTPHLNHLRSLENFVKAYDVYKRVRGAATKSRTMQKAVDQFHEMARNHAMDEVAIRTGKSHLAGDARIENNAKMTATFNERGTALEEGREDGEAPVTREVRRDITPPDINQPVKDRSTTVAEELGRLHKDFSSATGGHAATLRRILQKISGTAGDTPMHFVSREALDKLTERKPGEEGAGGIFYHFNSGKDSEGLRGHIYIAHDTMEDINTGTRAIIHEAAHAATAHALAQDPLLEHEVNQLREHVEAAVRTDVTLSEAERERYLNHYGIKANDPHEFLAEAMGNPGFQRLLAGIKIPKALAEEWGATKPTVWHAIVARMAKLFGIGPADISAFEHALTLFDKATEIEPRTSPNVRSLRDHAEGTIGPTVRATMRHSIRDTVEAYVPSRERLEDMVGNSTTMKHKLQRVGYKILSRDQWAQVGERLWGANSPAQRLSNLAARMSTEKDRLHEAHDERIIRGLADAERRYTASGTWDRFANLLHDETIAGVYADRPADKQPLKAKSLEGWQAHARLADLQNRYDALPADLKGLRKDLHSYFGERQDAMSQEIIRNVVRHANNGVPFDALADRIFKRTMTDADKKLITGDATLKALENVRGLTKINGPYVPLMRRGDWVVSGEHPLPLPKNHVTLPGKPDVPGFVRFKTDAEAKAFVENQPLTVLGVRHEFRDPVTHEKFGVDVDGKKVRLNAEEAKSGNAVQYTLVHLQHKHLEMHETELAAQRAHRELTSRGLTMKQPELRRFEPGGRGATYMSEQMQQLATALGNRNSFKTLEPEQQRVLLTHLHDASVQALGSTRVQSHRLPRTKVGGADTDITRNTQQYASSSAGYLARLKFQPQIDAVLKEMTDYQAGHAWEPDMATQRSQHLAEMKNRIYSQGEPERTGFWHGVGSRLLQVSYLDKLASPAFHVINSMEPWTVSMPVIAARHGIGRTLGAMNRAYADIGGARAVVAGVKDTGRAFRQDSGLTNYLTDFITRVGNKDKGAAQMLRYLADHGLISRDAGMELGRVADPSSNIAGRALDRADLMARQLGTAIESINRSVTGLAAYRLELERGASHADAMEFARKTVSNTMGDYSGANAPPIFNHPVGRIALQFKKYAQKTYFLLGKTAYGALHGRPEDMKAFAGIMATHMVLAGALGLPLEAVKAAFLGAQLTGLTTNNYGDFEQGVRRLAAGAAGNVGGEILTRGLPRALGVDLSSRVGLENLMLPLQDLKSTKSNDVFAYFAKALAGAPAAMVAEWSEGASAAAKGDFATAAQKWIPVKIFADSIMAAQKTLNGKKNASGRETLSPYTPVETATRVLGFTPGREAEAGERAGAVAGDSKAYTDKRNSLISSWVTATPGDKMPMWKQINEWNKGQPKTAQISFQQLTQAQQRRAAESKTDYAKDGIRTNKQTDQFRTNNNFYVTP